MQERGEKMYQSHPAMINFPGPVISKKYLFEVIAIYHCSGDSS